MWSLLLDVLFPPRATERTIRDYVASGKNLPLATDHHTNTITLLSYQDQIVHAAIVENKYYRNERARRLLSHVLSTHLATYGGPLVIVPIPLSKKRRRTRGYNQVEEVLKDISVPNGHTLHTLLVRTRDTPPQTSLNRIDRQKNMRDAFRVNQTILTHIPNPSTIILVDDVYTTGATLGAAKMALTSTLPETITVVCVALAH